jgi:tRNA pseudouridine38-40 synthase
MKKAAHLFEGKHNFTNYTKDKTKNPILTIDTINITVENKTYIIDIIAQRFLWNQIRRMIAAIKKAGKDEISLNDINKTLKYPHKEKSFGMSPPENLILMDVNYENINFTPINKSQKKIENIAQYYHMRAMMFKNMSTSP